MKPIPSKYFRQRQRELQRLLEDRGGSTRNAQLSIAEELEAEFLNAWGFSLDPDGAAQDMKMMAARQREYFDHCFDHCTCYCEPQTRSNVVVTQPYLEPGEVVQSLTSGLLVPGKVEPWIVAAPEWAFYYPGRATMVVVTFPPGYKRILQALNRLWSPAAQQSLTQN